MCNDCTRKTKIEFLQNQAFYQCVTLAVYKKNCCAISMVEFNDDLLNIHSLDASLNTVDASK